MQRGHAELRSVNRTLDEWSRVLDKDVAMWHSTVKDQTLDEDHPVPIKSSVAKRSSAMLEQALGEDRVLK